jgi:hypothetical protein
VGKFLITAILCASPWMLARAGTPAITVEPGNWGRASTAEVERVLRSVAEVYSESFSDVGLAPIRVLAGTGHPRVFYQKSGRGEYIVVLSAKDRRWAQYAYQFAHELCHVVSRFDNKDVEHQWFEEALCEVSSVFALRRMARAWEISPPAPRWRDYAPALAEFAEGVLSKMSHTQAARSNLATWYSQHRAALANDPYQWQHNEVAARLLLPLFEETASSWKAIGYLNVQRQPAKQSFAGYLHAWQRAVPAEQRPFVERLIAAFGLAGQRATRVALDQQL